jgi:hypothetical protein
MESPGSMLAVYLYWIYVPDDPWEFDFAPN